MKNLLTLLFTLIFKSHLLFPSNSLHQQWLILHFFYTVVGFKKKKSKTKHPSGPKQPHKGLVSAQQIKLLAKCVQSALSLCGVVWFLWSWSEKMEHTRFFFFLFKMKPIIAQNLIRHCPWMSVNKYFLSGIF